MFLGLFSTRKRKNTNEIRDNTLFFSSSSSSFDFNFDQSAERSSQFVVVAATDGGKWRLAVVGRRSDSPPFLLAQRCGAQLRIACTAQRYTKGVTLMFAHLFTHVCVRVCVCVCSLKSLLVRHAFYTNDGERSHFALSSHAVDSVSAAHRLRRHDERLDFRLLVSGAARIAQWDDLLDGEENKEVKTTDVAHRRQQQQQQVSEQSPMSSSHDESRPLRCTHSICSDLASDRR